MTYPERKKYHNRVVEDEPVSMRDLYEGMQDGHDRAEPIDASLYRRRRSITKIFRNSKYSPSLDDIEEIDESLPENGVYIVRSASPNLSLNFLHKERIRNSRGRAKRCRSRKVYGQSLDKLSES